MCDGSHFHYERPDVSTSSNFLDHGCAVLVRQEKRIASTSSASSGCYEFIFIFLQLDHRVMVLVAQNCTQRYFDNGVLRAFPMAVFCVTTVSIQAFVARGYVIQTLFTGRRCKNSLTRVRQEMQIINKSKLPTWGPCWARPTVGYVQADRLVVWRSCRSIKKSLTMKYDMSTVASVSSIRSSPFRHWQRQKRAHAVTSIPSLNKYLLPVHKIFCLVKNMHYSYAEWREN